MERSLSFKGPAMAKKIIPCKNSRKEMLIYILVTVYSPLNTV